MNPIMLRQFWTLVETNQADIPLTMDDQHLSHWLVCQTGRTRSLNREEADALNDYIHDRLPLIRQMAMGY